MLKELAIGDMARHQRWHVKRNVTDKNCSLCVNKEVRLTENEKLERRRTFGRSWRTNNLERARAHARKFYRKSVGIENATGETRIGTCPICLDENVRLVCDHDHKTGKVRGWPCVSCNTRVLGRLVDREGGLERLKKYLKGAKKYALSDIA